MPEVWQKGNLLQIEAQAASEELQLINLKNQLDISYLTIYPDA